MAAQTHGAVDNLLGLLSSAIKDEAQLLGGVHGDVQFIKDEMDSMNGFLMHLTKAEGEHDDQLRAWMKQVRDIAYVAEDCIELYVRDLSPPDAGLLAFLRHLPVYLWTAPSRHRLATKIRELKLRVREVGERRQRYGVTVPAAEIKPSPKPSGGQDESAREANRQAFRQALEEEDHLRGSGCRPSFSKAIRMLPNNNNKASSSSSSSKKDDEERIIHAVLEKCYQDGDADFSCMKMFLCALFLLDATAGAKLDNLEKKLQQGAEEPMELVRIFCYSMLSTQQKSCLQYLTAFLAEESIRRTCLVRRWVAEGLVGKEQERTPEEAGERCFGELLFRGFVVEAGAGDGGTVRSCCIEGPIREFIVRIAKSENFVSELPSHLERQLQIRKIVRKERLQEPQDRWRRSVVGDLCSCGGGGAPAGSDEEADRRATPERFKDPMDELVDYLKSLPQIYRLNVLDLGGCRGLKKRHLKSICKVVWLKYLSLRKTDVSRLTARHLQGLKNLETLDLRDTDVPPGDMSRIFLPKLKHLLAGCSSGAGKSAMAAAVPRRIGMMGRMETLTRVQAASEDGKELDGVAKLQQLRKLGVVVHANNHSTTRSLQRAIHGVARTLRSLAIWVTNDVVIIDISMQLVQAFSASNLSVLENLDIRAKCSLPPWIKEVGTLANITLQGTDMKKVDLHALGEAQGLRCLRLLGKSYSERELSLSSGQFESLRVLVVDDSNISSIHFVEGAAPTLEKIVFHVRMMGKEEAPCCVLGTHHLPNLKRVELTGHSLDTQQLSRLKQAMEEENASRTNKLLVRISTLLEG